MLGTTLKVAFIFTESTTQRRMVFVVDNKFQRNFEILRATVEGNIFLMLNICSAQEAVANDGKRRASAHWNRAPSSSETGQIVAFSRIRLYSDGVAA